MLPTVTRASCGMCAFPPSGSCFASLLFELFSLLWFQKKSPIHRPYRAVWSVLAAVMIIMI